MEKIIITFPETWGYDECEFWMTDMELDFISSSYSERTTQWQFEIIPEPK